MRHAAARVLVISAFAAMILLAFSQSGWAYQQPVGGALHDFPARVIALAYLVSQDPGDFQNNFLDKPGNQYLKTPFKHIFQIFPHYYGLAGALGFVSNYCVVEPTPGYFCGTRKLPENSQGGYLFVSKWITVHGKPYIVMIIGLLGPGQTSIVRIEGGKAEELYGSFNKKNKCGFKASFLDYSVIPTTHYVKVISPTTFRLIASGFQMGGPLSSAALKLTVDSAHCKLTVLPNKSETK